MTYRQYTILSFGVAFGAIAAVLPFAGLEQFAGDTRPVIAAMAIAAVSIACFVMIARPDALESYVKLASLAFFVLMLLGVLGLLSEMDPGVMQAGTGPIMPTGGTAPVWLGGK